LRSGVPNKNTVAHLKSNILVPQKIFKPGTPLLGNYVYTTTTAFCSS